jgi:hypothetical protein
VRCLCHMVISRLECGNDSDNRCQNRGPCLLAGRGCPGRRKHGARCFDSRCPLSVPEHSVPVGNEVWGLDRPRPSREGENRIDAGRSSDSRAEVSGLLIGPAGTRTDQQWQQEG